MSRATGDGRRQETVRNLSQYKDDQGDSTCGLARGRSSAAIRRLFEIGLAAKGGDKR